MIDSALVQHLIQVLLLAGGGDEIRIHAFFGVCNSATCTQSFDESFLASFSARTLVQIFGDAGGLRSKISRLARSFSIMYSHVWVSNPANVDQQEVLQYLGLE